MTTSISPSSQGVSARHIATTLVALADADSESDNLSPLRIQKLLYYAQGWSLALRDQRIFPDRIQAWRYGPVVPMVYADLSCFGKAGIAPEQLQEHDEYDVDPLGEEDNALVVAVWEAYRRFSAVSLVEMTHSEPPWISARGTTPETDHCDAFLDEELMREYFVSLSHQ